MIRTFIENLLLFLLPTFIYVAWMLFQRAKVERATGEEPKDDGRAPVAVVLDEAPLLWLFASGAILVVLTLSLFGSTSGGKPGQQYQPSVFKDGKIQPSHID